MLDKLLQGAIDRDAIDEYAKRLYVGLTEYDSAIGGVDLLVEYSAALLKALGIDPPKQNTDEWIALKRRHKAHEEPQFNDLDMMWGDAK